MTQPFFNKSKIKSIFVSGCTLGAILLLSTWAAKKTKVLYFDWTFTLPTISLIATLIPVGSATIDWFEKKINVFDSRLDSLEPLVLNLRDSAISTKQEHEDLRRMLLRQEAKTEYIKDNLSKIDVPSIVSANKALLEKMKSIGAIDDKER